MAVGFQEEGRWMYTGGEDGKYKFICRDALPLTKDNIKVRQSQNRISITKMSQIRKIMAHYHANQLL